MTTDKKTTDKNFSRRDFLQTATAATVAAGVIAGAPFVHADSKTGLVPVIIGNGDYRYEWNDQWAQLPDKYTWQTTHNVTIDKAGNVYIVHNGDGNKKDHPSIFVFDPTGKFIKAFGRQFQGGAHGLDLREEGGQEFLYVCANGGLHTFAKLDLDGNIIWQKYAPVESGAFTDADGKVDTGRFKPTNIAFLEDGGFMMADGYGTSTVHCYDKDGNWKSVFGGGGNKPENFSCPHGLGLDKRPGREPAILICDRGHNVLKYVSQDGKLLEVIPGDYQKPCHIDTYKNLLLVPELQGRVSLYNEKNEPVARLGDNTAQINGPGGGSIRVQPDKWVPGKCTQPHDACFMHNGDIIVTEWVGTGRVIYLKRVS